jgi:hypothetical protein
MATVLWSNAEQHLAIVLKAAPVEKLHLKSFDQISKQTVDFLQFARDAITAAYSSCSTVVRMKSEV